jgi:hypothetical protein
LEVPDGHKADGEPLKAEIAELERRIAAAKTVH